MGLKIGQVAQLTGMSVEAIRFYEKEKIISPDRSEGSAYRLYDVWDVFELNESLQYRNMGFPLKEIKAMLRTDTLEELDRRISGRYREIESRIEYQHMLARYLAAYHERIASARYNIGKYWIKREEEQYYIPYCTRHHGTYSDADYTSPVLRQWLQTAPFYRTQLHTDLESILQKKEEDIWALVLEKDYFRFLGLSETEEVRCLPGGLFLHTIIDMGEKGDVGSGIIRPAIEYMRACGHEAEGPIYGEILIKSHDGPVWHRYMELKIPVKK